MKPLSILVELAEHMSSLSDGLTVSTTRLGEILNVSQQTASRYVIALEEDGLIERQLVRDGQKIRLSAAGIDTVKDFHTQLGRLINEKGRLVLSGKISSGIGEGAHYVKKYARHLKEYTGYTPYPGTLNISTAYSPDLKRYVKHTIKSFKDGARTYGNLDVIPVTLTHDGQGIDCHLILPERTHHKRVLEIIYRKNLREELGIKDDSEVTCGFSA
ncbi:DUF120 domain-containing protein [Candidatus Altiarchaeota archaeon]